MSLFDFVCFCSEVGLKLKKKSVSAPAHLCHKVLLMCFCEKFEPRSHFKVEFDHQGECSPEYDCCF